MSVALEPYTSVCSVAHWMRGQTWGKRAPADLVAVTVAYPSIWILRQPEPKRFIWAWIKYFVGAGPGTFDFRYVMHAKARTLVKRTRVLEGVLATCLVDVKANHLVADWAFGDNWVKALTSRHLGEFANQNVKLPHDQSSSFANAGFDLDQVTARRQNSRSSLTPVHYGLVLFKETFTNSYPRDRAKTTAKSHCLISTWRSDPQFFSCCSEPLRSSWNQSRCSVSSCSWLAPGLREVSLKNTCRIALSK